MLSVWGRTPASREAAGTALGHHGLRGEQGFVWAALDSPSGSACIPPPTRTVLAAVEAPVHAAAGRRVARAEALWITLRTD